jgi:hypothetical protein
MVAVAGGDILDMTKLSRRKLLQSSGWALAYLLAGTTLTARSPGTTKSLSMRLIQEFSKRSILDISPDGSKLCFDNWSNAKYPLEAVEMGTWKIIFSGSFQTRVWFAWFFSNNSTLLAETRITLGNRRNVPHLTSIELKTGNRTEGRHFADNVYEDDPAIALSDGVLLIKHINWKSIEKCSIALVEFPSYREISRVPFVVKPDESEFASLANYRANISGDRRVFLYYYGRTLVCRRTENLEVLWMREIGPLLKVIDIASPNQNYVAVAVADSAFRDQQKESYISIYNGKTGTDVARMNICGTDGLAISPDGSLLAVVEIVNSRENKTYYAKVHVYDVKSGEILASFEHDQIKWQRGGTIKAACRVYFTADGQHLISSGMNTKVWRFGRNAE